MVPLHLTDAPARLYSCAVPPPVMRVDMAIKAKGFDAALWECVPHSALVTYFATSRLAVSGTKLVAPD